MRTAAIVSRVPSDGKDHMHAARWQRLADLSNAAVNGQALALTQLALGSASPTTVRHRAKAVDRFLGNPAFAAEHPDIDRTPAAHWLQGASPLPIVVDWSRLSADMARHWLRASVAREPWLLSCAQGLANFPAEAIVRLCAQRMKIEQGFLDTRNERPGLGLTRSRSHGQRRLEALPLTGHVASIAKRVIGGAAKAVQVQLGPISRKQASHHNRAGLSLPTVAARVIAPPVLMRKIGNPLACLRRLRGQAGAASLPAAVAS